MKFMVSFLFLSTSGIGAFSAGPTIRPPRAMSSSSSSSMPSLHQSSTSVDAPPAMSRAQIKAPVFDEVCETTGVPLRRFMNEVALLNPELSELTTLFGAVDTACKAMSNLVKRSQLPSSETLGYQGEINVQGEDQKKLDVITNDLLKRALRFTGRLGVLASEEEDVPVRFVCVCVCVCILVYSIVCVEQENIGNTMAY